MENIFLWENNNLGGTEVALKWFHQNILPDMKKIKKYRCISVPGAPQNIEELFDGKKNILWLHLTPNQIDDNGMNLIKRKDFLQTVEHIITISEFHKKRTILELNVNPEIVHVINYPLYGTEFNESKFKNIDSVKIIHASQAVRGLEILLRSIAEIKEDFELDIYNDFYPEQHSHPKLKELIEDPRVTFYGKTPRQTLMKKFASSHIHAYPSIFEETGCLVQIEAIASGNLCVYSNVGCLEEISKGHGIMVDFFSKNNMDEIIKDYSNNLLNAINIVKNGHFDPNAQIKDIVKERNYDFIKKQWLDFENVL
jgi:glycosyltransferase involved in cell wall biosynthesis